jgi:hypothetical protein
MPWKQKALKACIENLQAARETFSGKQQRSTPAESNLSDGNEGRISDDEIVQLNSFKPQLKLIYNIPDGQ